ncbi:acyl-CoA dehydrogenase family protein [Nocardia callitridis]|uniref:Acyl-CoA dehydrogenase family protein n=1 Tax=Nocardia callitridis TaxID=648753 RepID=A0ABP9KKE4_9NOCA
MAGGFDEFHPQLRAVARSMLAASAGSEVDPRSIVDSGWLGLEAPESLGGAGATFAETAVVLREVGRAAADTRYPSIAVSALGALGVLEPSTERDRLLRDTVSGETTTCLVVDGEAMADSGFRVKSDTTGLVVDGAADFVADAVCADRLLVVAVDADGSPVIAEFDRDTPGLVVAPTTVLDSTRRFGRVVADSARPRSVSRFHGDPWRRVRTLHDRAAVAVACDSLGLSEAMLEATVTYARTRQQFGRPIGSFQAVKHACADMLVRVRVAEKLVAAAVRELAEEQRPYADVTVAMAKSYACASAVEVVGKAMQLHGGIGYTWDADLHVYLKRATLNRALFGTPRGYRARLAARYR